MGGCHAHIEVRLLKSGAGEARVVLRWVLRHADRGAAARTVMWKPPAPRRRTHGDRPWRVQRINPRLLSTESRAVQATNDPARTSTVVRDAGSSRPTNGT